MSEEEKLNINNINYAEVKTIHIKISHNFATLINLDKYFNISCAWETIRKNIITSIVDVL
jgi:hypothetical protein